MHKEIGKRSYACSKKLEKGLRMLKEIEKRATHAQRNWKKGLRMAGLLFPGDIDVLVKLYF